MKEGSDRARTRGGGTDGGGLTLVEGGRPKAEKNAARRRRQEAQAPRTVEDHTGAVHDPRATTLRVPEEKRCTALTTRGARCKAPRLRGLTFCMFHGHLAAKDEVLATITDPSKNPALSPRAALQAVARHRAGELAELAVEGAASASERDGGRAILALVDAVDPLREETASVRLTADDVGALSFAELAIAVRSLTPSNGSVEPRESTAGGSGHPVLDAGERG